MTPEEWAQAIGGSMVAVIIITMGVVTAWRKLVKEWRELMAENAALKATNAAAADLREIKEQVTNSHATNLRNDMDETKRIAADAHQEAILAKESAHRTERLVKDLKVSMAALENSMDRRVGIQTKAVEEVRGDLTDHVEDVPEVIEDALGKARQIAAGLVSEHEQRYHQG